MKELLNYKGHKVLAIKGAKSILFNSIEEAADYCNTYTNSIQRIFKGKQRLANGWTFKRG